MSIVIGDDGCLEVGPPPENDPVRQSHAKLVREIAWLLEGHQQMSDGLDISVQQLKRRVTELERVVSVLEKLVIGEAA